MKILLKKCSIICTLLILLFNLTGCYDAHGIEELAYAVAIGLDTNENNELELTLQFAQTGSSESKNSEGSSQSEGSIISSVICSSISSGIALINSHISKKIDLSHCQQIVFSEELAELGLSEYLDTFTNNVEIRTDCAIVISKAKAKDYLKNVKPSLESLTARYYESTLNTNDYTGYTVNVKLAEFYSAIKDDYSQACAILGGINTNNYTNTAKINADYTAGENPVSDSDIIETARHVLHKLPEMPVYARVDGTIINNQFLLNELELIEPALYLDRWKGATERFVDVLKSRILK